MAAQPILLNVSVQCKPSFEDLDIMQVVWHGRYWHFIEQARNALFEHIGYGYGEMIASGYQWPIVKAEIKYIQPITLNQPFQVTAQLLEYENRVKLRFVFQAQDGKVLAKAESVQVAVAIGDTTLQFVTPDCFQQRLRPFLNKVA